MIDQPALYAVEPDLVERACGGWLAVTPRGWPISVGVTATSRDAAALEFKAALARWAAVVAKDCT